MNQRIENIENILKMLLVNNVLNNDTIEMLKEEMKVKYEPLFLSLGLCNIRFNYIENAYYIFAEVGEKTSLKEIKRIAKQIDTEIKEVRFVFSFDKLNSKRKKSLEEAEISYCISNGEMKIFKRDCGNI